MVKRHAVWIASVRDEVGDCVVAKHLEEFRRATLLRMCRKRSPLALVDGKPQGILETIFEAYARLWAEVERGYLRILELLELLLLGAELGLGAATLLCAELLLLALALLALTSLLLGLALRLAGFLAGLALRLALFRLGLALLGLGLLPLRLGALFGYAGLFGRDTLGLALLAPPVPAHLAADCDDKKHDDESDVGDY